MPNTINAVDIEIAVSAIMNPRKNLVVPNVSWGLLSCREADLLVVYPSGWMSEVESKVTAQDIKADKKKGKWRRMPDPRIRHFWFAVPENLKDHPDIPEHAGIIAVKDLYEQDREKLRLFNALRKKQGLAPIFEQGYNEQDEAKSPFQYWPIKEVKAFLKGEKLYSAYIVRHPKKLTARKVTDAELEILKRLLWLRVWTLKRHLAREKQKTQRLKKRIKELECQAKPN